MRLGRPVHQLLRRILLFLLRLIPLALRRRLVLRPYRAACAQLLSANRRPEGAQGRALQSIVRQNQHTEFGKAHGFGTITDLDQFCRKVPLRAYRELEPYIERQLAGERDILVSGQLHGFAVDTVEGSAQRVAPITTAGLNQAEWFDELVRYAVLRSCPRVATSQWLDILPTHRAPPTDSSYLIAPLPALLSYAAASRQGATVVPPQVFTVQDEQLRYYLMLRLALGQPLGVLRAACPGTLAIFADHLEQQADQLIDDLGTGTVSHLDQLAPAVRDAIAEQVADPSHARRLRQLAATRGRLHPRDVWPELAAAVCTASGNATEATHRLSDHFGPLTVIDQGLQQAFGAITAPQPYRSDGSLAILGGHVLELLEMQSADGDDNGVPIPATHATAGKRYAPIVTAHNGYYRLRTTSQVEVTEMRDGVPRLAIVGMEPPRLELGEASLTEAQVCEAFAEAARDAQVVVAVFTCWPGSPANNGSPPTKPDDHAAEKRGFWPRFLSRAGQTAQQTRRVDSTALRWAIETDEAIDPRRARRLLQATDKLLQQSCTGYAKARESGKLADPDLVVLRRGTLSRRTRDLLAAGLPGGHDNPPRLRSLPLELRDADVVAAMHV